MADIKNAEEYPDPTAYQALRKAVNVFPGEVYTREGIKSSATEYNLVLAVKDNVITTVKLCGKSEGCNFQVRGTYYTNLAMIGYKFENTLGEYRFQLTDEEFDNVKEGLAKYFGLILTAGAPAEEKVETISTKKKLEAMFGSSVVRKYMIIKAAECLINGDTEEADECFRYTGGAE